MPTPRKSPQGTQAAIAEFQIVGVEKVMAKLVALDKKVRGKIERKAIRQAGRPVLASAKRLAPIAEEYDLRGGAVPGVLQRSLRLRAMKRTASRRRAGIYGVQVQSGAEANLFKGETFYGGMVEFGTRYQDPQRFLAAAADETREASNVIMRQEISRYVLEECQANG